VEEYLSTEGKNYEVSIRILRENELQGTAGTLKNFLDGIQVNKELLLAHADNLSWFDLSEFLRAHETRPTQAEITMMTFETDNPESCGIVELNDQNMIEQFHEKKTNAPGTTASGAVFLLSKKAQMEIKGMTKRVDFSAQILPHFLDKIYTWKNTCYHRDIGEPTSYKKAEIEFDLIRKIKK
jgi:mannose-1-phosphate guanylyltransferase